jgi:predicted PurR-regulated permease PerM
LAILSGTAVLALLYFGREVLVPITLALILSLAVAPIVRLLRQVGLGQVGAVLAAAAALGVLWSAW